MKYVDKNKENYNGFNLIIGDISLPEPSVWYIGNRDDASTEKLKKNTVYGISNGSLNTYWKKVDRGKKLFAKAIDEHTDLNDLVHRLLNVLSDKKDFSMEKIPKTAFTPNLEKCCAPICIERERFNGTIFENEYATRTHTVIIIDNDNHVTFVEQDQYDTISNNYIMKQQCYLLPPNVNTETKDNDSSDNNSNKNSNDNDDNDNDNPNTTPANSNNISNGIITNIGNNNDTTNNLTFNSITSYNNYVSRIRPESLPVSIPIPFQRKNSSSSSFHRTYTTSISPELSYISSLKKYSNSFDNIHYNPNNPSPLSFSSIENITGDILDATSLSSSNSSPHNRYMFNSPVMHPSSITSNYSIPPLYSDLYYNNNISIEKDSDFEYEEEEEKEKEKEKEKNKGNIRIYIDHKSDNESEEKDLEDTFEKFSMKSSSSKRTINSVCKIPTLFSCTPISPTVFDFFETNASNDYKDKTLDNQYVKRNVHDFSKANIHQFKLKL